MTDKEDIKGLWPWLCLLLLLNNVGLRVASVKS